MRGWLIWEESIYPMKVILAKKKKKKQPQSQILKCGKTGRPSILTARQRHSARTETGKVSNKMLNIVNKICQFYNRVILVNNWISWLKLLNYISRVKVYSQDMWTSVFFFKTKLLFWRIAGSDVLLFCALWRNRRGETAVIHKHTQWGSVLLRLVGTTGRLKGTWPAPTDPSTSEINQQFLRTESNSAAFYPPSPSLRVQESAYVTL